MEFKVFSLALGVTLVAESIQVATNLSRLVDVSRQAALDGARGAFKELKKSSRKIIQWIEEAMEQKSEYPRRKSTFGAINFLFYELINNIEVYSVT